MDRELEQEIRNITKAQAAYELIAGLAVRNSYSLELRVTKANMEKLIIKMLEAKEDLRISSI